MVCLSVLLALRYESLVIALLGIIGAFLAPILMGRDIPEPWLVLVYILVVDLGILGVSTFRHWRWFTLVGMSGTYGIFALWLGHFDTTAPILVESIFVGVFLVFVGATTMFHIIWRRVPNPADMSLMTLNALGFYALTFALLWDDYEIWFGLISLSLAIFYLLVAYAAIKRSGVPAQVALFALAIAAVFLTVAVPLQLSGHWISVAWAAEGTVLIWVGFQLVRWQMRAFGLAALTLAAVRLLIFDTQVDLTSFTPVLNERFPTFVAVIAAWSVTSYVYWRERDLLEGWEQHVASTLAGLANFITLWLLTAEVIAYFDSRVMLQPFQMLLNDPEFVSSDRYHTEAGIFRSAAQSLENGKLLTMTAMWAFYALGILALGIAKRSAPVRWGGLGMLAVPAIKLLLIDTFAVRLEPLTFLPVVNFQFLVFTIVLGVMVLVAYLYKRNEEQLTNHERYVFQALLVAANVVTIGVFSTEAIRFFDSQEAKLGTDFFSAMHLTLTVLWAVYAIGIIVTGIAKQSSRMRLAGMALLAVPVAKLFVFDIFLLDKGYRIAAFVILGGLLLAIGLVYQRYSQAIRGFLFGQRR